MAIEFEFFEQQAVVVVNVIIVAIAVYVDVDGMIRFNTPDRLQLESDKRIQ